MSMPYKVMYAVGFTPWDPAGDGRLGSGELAEFFARDEVGEPPYGRALDVGCGRGRYSVELARRGWQVTGIDAVPKAVAAARENAGRAGAQATFVCGDATRLSQRVGIGFRYVIDIGCFHGLADAQRAAVMREENAVTEPGATLLMLAFSSGRRRPLPRGISRDELLQTYAGWSLVSDDAVDVAAAPRLVRRAAPRYYRLRRD